MHVTRSRWNSSLRWGFVGTGSIAGAMAGVLRNVPNAKLAAVASRRLDTARAFAGRHGADRAFDDWRNMIAWAGVDAVYIATPTSLREEIAAAAARAGKHVLGEKPFASLSSLRRITDACREHGVCFMDATHFVHHPRHRAVLDGLEGAVGRPRVLRSSFVVSLADRGDIRYEPALEPLGALGDLGWYNLRATLEYLAPKGLPKTVRSSLRRDDRTGAIIEAEVSLGFDDDSASEWRCGFTAASVDIGLELVGPRGRLLMDDFVGNDEDGSASYRRVADHGPQADGGLIRVESPHGGPALMFEDFARAVADASLHENRMQASERTQALVDAVLAAADEEAGR